eukprot:TRINITY_DN31687_c0_g1_i1.p1 TRINITY_DN31687_c0_g1~~TRINITY_DN31687_c0_g1_i1.p1  ORF type:complete len:323 (+),score=59.57 TRINITY_DN31687_c0_g1_i1:15-983(+)
MSHQPARGGAKPLKKVASATRDAAVWRAVALQQHFSLDLGLGAMRGQRRTQKTMAEKMGCVEEEAPQKMTDDDWEHAIRKADNRKDSSVPCAICCEGYTDKKQVILSCSHVFHESCITNLEKFATKSKDIVTGKPLLPTCPICRSVNYEKATCTLGNKEYRREMATKVQKVFRGWLGRRKAVRYRLEIDPKFREEYEYKLIRRKTGECIKLTEENSNNIDELFATLDRERAVAKINTLTESDWDGARHQLITRGMSDCSICMTSLLPNDESAREVLLLSCSHCFHAPCLLSFEQYDQTIDSEPADKKCPLCRSAYLTRPLYE